MNTLIAHPIHPSIVDGLSLNLSETPAVDVASLFRPEFRKYIPVRLTLRDAALEVISKINEAIRQQPNTSLQNRHVISLKTGETPWMKNGSNLYFFEQYFGLPSGHSYVGIGSSKNSWLHRIFQALIDKGQIRSYQIAESGYRIVVC